MGKIIFIEQTLIDGFAELLVASESTPMLMLTGQATVESHLAARAFRERSPFNTTVGTL
jgi:hypothetical protein